MVFENFTAEDQGRGRKLICVCTTPEQAKAMCEKHNKELEKTATNFHIEDNLEIIKNENVYNTEEYFIKLGNFK